jgi:flagellar biosynthesis protein FlhB
MSDDRTIEPSPRRIREARQRGMVPVSGELTAAVGLLATTAALGVWGDGLISGILGLVRGVLDREDLAVADVNAFVELARLAIGSVAVPLTCILAAPVLASLVAHQVQAGGLFESSLALPDPARLRPGTAGGSPADRLGRAFGVILRGALLVGLAWWTIRGTLENPAVATAADAGTLLRVLGGILHASMFRLGLVLLVLGLAHHALNARRIAAKLRMTAEERREEQRSQEGDPGLPARRRAARGRSIGTIPAEAAPSTEAI